MDSDRWIATVADLMDGMQTSSSLLSRIIIVQRILSVSSTVHKIQTVIQTETEYESACKRSCHWQYMIHNLKQLASRLRILPIKSCTCVIQVSSSF